MIGDLMTNLSSKPEQTSSMQQQAFSMPEKSNDREYRKKHKVTDVKTDVVKSKAENTTVQMNDLHFKAFFKQLWQKPQKGLGINQNRGFSLINTFGIYKSKRLFKRNFIIFI